MRRYEGWLVLPLLPVAYLLWMAWTVAIVAAWLVLPYDWLVRLPGMWQRDTKGRKCRVFSDGRVEYLA